MFCNQSRFDLPTAIVTASIFNQLVDSAQTRWLTREHRKLREALPSILEGDAELLNQWAQDENFIKFCQGQEASRKKASGGKTKGEAFIHMVKVNHTQTIQSTCRLLPPATQLSACRSGLNLGCNKDDKRQRLLEVVAVRLKLLFQR